jgi:predicted DCC family thiol-disulfide oxidoreductase YuxK
MEVVVLFDGVCNLCNSSVNFIIDHNSKNDIRFAPLQSKYGNDLIADQGITEVPDSLILWQNKKLFFKSDAALHIAAHLNYPFRILFFLRFIPKGIRDYLYDWVAKNRYRWFGRQDQCRMPDPTLQDRFINSEIVS